MKEESISKQLQSISDEDILKKMNPINDETTKKLQAIEEIKRP